MLFGVFGLVVAGAVLGATSLQTVPDVIQAKKFEVVNDEGKVIVQMDSLLHQGTEYGFITTSSSKGGTLVELGATADGEGLVVTENGKGGRLIELGVGADTGGDGIGKISTQNGNGGTVVAITSTVDGEGLIRTENGKGGKLVQLGVTNDRVGNVVTQNGKGSNLVLIGAINGSGVVATMNEKREFTSFTPEQ